MQENLTDLQIAKIEAFMADTEMVEAVKRVLLAGIYSHGVIEAGYKHDPLQNGALSLAALSTNNPIPDEQLGQHIRGVWAGLNALENAFKNLSNVSSKIESPYEEINEAI
jgi:hypothetical protein